MDRPKLKKVIFSLMDVIDSLYELDKLLERLEKQTEDKDHAVMVMEGEGGITHD